MKWIVIIYLALNIVASLIPALLVQIQSFSSSLGGIWNILIRFLFDPTEYVWKWIIGLLIMVVLVIKK